MTLKELIKKIGKYEIPDDFYFINGIYGSTNDENKISMRIHSAGYEIYHSERGEKTVLRNYENENDACKYFFEKLKNSIDLKRIRSISNLKTMDVETRLNSSGLKDEFDQSLINNKNRAKEILRWLKVDEHIIKSLVK